MGMVILHSLKGKKDEAVTWCWAQAQCSMLCLAALCRVSEHSSSDTVYFFSCALCTGLTAACTGEEWRRNAVETKYRGFIPLHVISASCNRN